MNSNTDKGTNIAEVTLEDEFRYFDKLPPKVRTFLMNEPCVSFGSQNIYEVMYDMFGPCLDAHTVVRHLRAESRRMHVQAYGCRPESYDRTKRT